MKKVFGVFFVFCLMATTLIGCQKDSKKEFGDFLYDIVYYNGNGEQVVKEKGIRSCVRILALSEGGKKKEIIVFPRYIENIRVEELGCDIPWGGTRGIIESSKLKKIFFPYSISISSDAIQDGENLDGVFMLRHDVPEYYISAGLSIFLTSYNYTNDNITNFYYSDGYSSYYFSNLSYYYNYDQSPNDGYYWMDNYKYGEKIEYIPENPMREGYEFEGWYKEIDCINKWDFETDVLPLEQLDSEGNIIYQETKLFAKWIKN